MIELHHIAFRTGDVAALARFYCDMLGFEVVRNELPGSMWLRIDRGAVLMIEARANREPPIAPGSMELIAFRGSEHMRCEVRQKALDRNCYDGETVFTVYLRDPDGRRVGVSTYDLAAPTESR